MQTERKRLAFLFLFLFFCPSLFSKPPASYLSPGAITQPSVNGPQIWLPLTQLISFPAFIFPVLTIHLQWKVSLLSSDLFLSYVCVVPPQTPPFIGSLPTVTGKHTRVLRACRSEHSHARASLHIISLAQQASSSSRDCRLLFAADGKVIWGRLRKTLLM